MAFHLIYVNNYQACDRSALSPMSLVGHASLASLLSLATGYECLHWARNLILPMAFPGAPVVLRAGGRPPAPFLAPEGHTRKSMVASL